MAYAPRASGATDRDDALRTSCAVVVPRIDIRLPPCVMSVPCRPGVGADSLGIPQGKAPAFAETGARTPPP